MAEVVDGELLRLENGRTRSELVDHLVAVVECHPETIVGLDFAFSLPCWYLNEKGISSAPELWETVHEEGERWLKAHEPPFWGWRGSRKPKGVELFRCTDKSVGTIGGIRPKSVFQLLGPGAVGTGSLRGMPHLLDLREAGFSIWPFDLPQLPVVLEIYPRLLTGRVRKSDRGAREAYLAREHAGLDADFRSVAAWSGDAFDAVVSSLAMARHADELRRLERPRGSIPRLEGAIWWPGWKEAFEAQGSDTLLNDALTYASKLHGEQRRKGPDGAPYIAHLLGVCSLVLEAGGDEEQAIAALLHDAPEDQGGRAQLEEIRRRFGERVAGIVEACSDTLKTPKPPWRLRKESYVEHLRAGSRDALLVACADKLYNAQSILRDFRLVGPDVFNRFNASREETLWYYQSVAEALKASELESWMLEELGKVVEELIEVASS